MTDRRGPPRGEWLLRALIRALPAPFRARHAEDLLDCYRDAWANESHGRGIVGACAFWVSSVAGLAATVVRHRWPGRGAATADVNGEGSMEWEAWSTEVKQAARRLARRPGYALVVIATLGIGLGANAAVFSVLHSVVLAPLPYDGADRLVRVYGSRRDTPEGNQRNYLTAPAALELRDVVESLESVAILQNYSAEGADLTGGDAPERVRMLRVGSGYFDVLGVLPVAGRVFQRADERADSRVAVVREDLWRRYLGARRDAVGSTLLVDGEALTVVGVVGDGVRDPLEGLVDLWLPTDLSGPGATNWDNNYLSAFARLAPESAIEALRTELDLVADRHGQISSEAAGVAFNVVPLHDDVVGSADRLLGAIMGAVGFLLLLTCVNVASLLLARAAARQRELAIRASLGSSRRALIRHFAVETSMLAVAGGVAGIGVGVVALRVMMAVAPAGLPRREAVAFGPEAVLLAGAAAIVIGLALGLATALPFTRPRVSRIASGVRTSGGADSRAHMRSALVAVEAALAVVLVSGAGVLLRTVDRLQSRDLGVEPAGVLTFEVGLPDARYPTDPDLARFSEELHGRLAALPGVTSVAATSRLPVTGSANSFGTRRAHAPGEPFDTPNLQVNQRWIAGDYFETAGLEIVEGRAFTDADAGDVPYVTVVNRTLVRALFGDEPPLGSYLRIAGRYTTIVGVVEDEALTSRTEAAPMAYHHQRQWISGSRESTRMMAVSGDAFALLPAVRAALREVDADLVLHDARMLDHVIGAGIAQERFAAWLLGGFAALAVLLAGLGLYGVLSHHVGSQRHELGVRMALGADAPGVVSMIVRRGVRLAGAGALAGALLAVAMGGSLEAFVYDVSARDPLVILGAAGLLVVVALLSSYVPAVRATRVDPLESFRAG